MARIRKRGKNWEYEIKQNGKIVARGSGFSRKKDAERDARKVELSIGNQSLHYELKQDMTLVELFNSWLNIEILPQAIQPQTKKKYLKRLAKIQEYFGDSKVSDIVRSQYQMFINWYGMTYEINEVGRMNANIKKAVEFAKADKILIDDRFLLNIKLNSKKIQKILKQNF